MAQDASEEARDAAIRDLLRFLSSPASLSSMASIRSDYLQRLQMEPAGSGTEVRLDTSQIAIPQLLENFAFIDKLRRECHSLINNYDLASLSSFRKHNLDTTSKDVDDIVSISIKATDERDPFADNAQLVDAFERLTVYEGQKRFALETTSSSRKEETCKSSESFENVNKTREKFELPLWGYIRNFYKLSKDSPQTLVQALRVVEMQEMLDQEQQDEAAEFEGRSTSGLASDRGNKRSSEQYAMGMIPPRLSDYYANGKQGRNYKQRCFQEIAWAVEKRFDLLIFNLVDKDLDSALKEASAIAGELPDIHDYVAPCFPPRYAIFVTIVQLYTERFLQMLSKLVDKINNLTNPEILKVASWVAQYEEQLLSLGVDQSLAQVCAESGAMDPLIDTYVDRMQQAMQDWCTNILNLEKEHPVKRTEDGKCYTMAAVDLFRILSEQYHVVEASSSDVMLYRIGLAVITVMSNFQAAQRLLIKDPGDPGLELTCAIVNNNLRCYDLSKELSLSIRETLAVRYEEKVNFEDTCKGFLEVAKEGVQRVVKAIFEDGGVKDLLTKLYQKDWYEGHVTSCLVETLRDYFSSIKLFVRDRGYQWSVELCLEETIIVFVDYLLTQRNYIRQETLEQMSTDEEALRVFFCTEINQQKVEKCMQPLAYLRELASATSENDFVVAYAGLLQDQPDCPPEVVEKVLALREGIPRKVVRTVVQECREIYNKTIFKGGPPQPGLLFSRLRCLSKTPSMRW